MRGFWVITRYLFGLFFTLVFLGILVVALGYSYLEPGLPSVEQLKNMQFQVPLRIYTSENRLMAEYGEKRRIPLSLDEIPKPVQEAFIAAEDARFYEHPGIDIKGFARASVNLLQTGEKTQGASTITMQVARNFFLGREKTYTRKLREILLALKIEKTLSKEEILELYLNKIYLGNRAYGIGAAANVYYGKTVDELNTAQIAMLSGLPKAPSRYNPIVAPERAQVRRDYILNRMYNLNYISLETLEIALDTTISAKVHQRPVEVRAPYMAEMVRAEIVKRYGDEAYTRGLHVYTTLDTDLQSAAIDSLRTKLHAYDRRHGYRGPVDHIEVGDSPNQEELLQQLKKYRVIAQHIPAIVLNTTKREATLLSHKGLVQLELKQLKWARKYISEDRRGRRPRKIRDVMKVGDIVYVKRDEENVWELGQLPKVAGALVSVRPKDGAVQAIVGGYDFKLSKFNRATQATRQPGSSFKPFVYAAALEKRYTPDSIINDAPIYIPGSDWRPENYSGKFYGPTSLKVALAKSRNLVSIRLLRKIGIDYTIDYAKRFGFRSEQLPRNLTLALGTGVVTPLEMAGAYTAFANGGFKVDPYFITRIDNVAGDTIFEANPTLACDHDHNCVAEPENKLKTVDGEHKGENEKEDSEEEKTPKKYALGEYDPEFDDDDFFDDLDDNNLAERIISSDVHYNIVSMMKGVVDSGTARRAKRVLKRDDMAGKTGTTNDQRDAWFCGFTQQRLTVVWMGFDDFKPLGEGETSTHAALPLWIDFMQYALKDVPEKTLEKPTVLVKAEMDKRRKKSDDKRKTKVAKTKATKKTPSYREPKYILADENTPPPRSRPKPRPEKRESERKPAKEKVVERQPIVIEIPEQLF